MSVTNALAASDLGSDTEIGVPSFTDRGMWRSLGMNTSGVRPTIDSTSSSVMPTLVCARFSTSDTCCSG